MEEEMLKTWHIPGPWLMLTLLPLPVLLPPMSLGTPTKLSQMAPSPGHRALKQQKLGNLWNDRSTRLSTALNLSTQERQTSRAVDNWCHYQIVNYQLAQPWQEIVRHCQTSRERQNLLTALPLSAPVWQLWASWQSFLSHGTLSR